MGRAEAALAALDSLPLRGVHATSLRRIRAWALFETQRFDALVAFLKPWDTLPAELTFLRASGRLHLGDPLGPQTLRHLWWEDGNGIWGLLALGTLAARVPELYGHETAAAVVPILPRPRPNSARTAPSTVPRALSKLDATLPLNGRLRAELHHVRGLRWLHQEGFSQARDELEAARRNAQDPALLRTILLHLGETLRRQGQYEEARDLFDQAAAGFQDALSADAHARAGTMAIQFRRYPEAQRRFERQLVEHPVSDWRHQALWSLGWIAFRTGSFVRAQRFFSTLLTESPYGQKAPAAQYWRARALEELGATEEARAELVGLLQQFPVDYYAYRAQERLGDAPRPRPFPPETPSLWPEIDHAEALVAAGMERRAQRTLWRATGRLDAYGSEALARLASVARAVDYQGTAIRLDRQRNARFPEVTAIDVATLRRAFPRDFDAMLVAAAKKERIEPGWVVGVVRCESSFDAGAVSPAGALGLMQLMPTTARDLWQERRGQQPFRTEMLFDVDTNVRLGARYLARMLRAFGTRAEYALAAYNAGPGAVTRWRQARGDLPVDIFVEEIPYAETRAYVRRVVAARQTWEFLRTAETELKRPAPLAQAPEEYDHAPTTP